MAVRFAVKVVASPVRFQSDQSARIVKAIPSMKGSADVPGFLYVTVPSAAMRSAMKSAGVTDRSAIRWVTNWRR